MLPQWNLFDCNTIKISAIFCPSIFMHWVYPIFLFLVFVIVLLVMAIEDLSGLKSNLKKIIRKQYTKNIGYGCLLLIAMGFPCTAIIIVHTRLFITAIFALDKGKERTEKLPKSQDRIAVNRKDHFINFSQLPYLLRVKIYEKFTYNQIAKFAECSNLADYFADKHPFKTIYIEEENVDFSRGSISYDGWSFDRKYKIRISSHNVISIAKTLKIEDHTVNLDGSVNCSPEKLIALIQALDTQVIRVDTKSNYWEPKKISYFLKILHINIQFLTVYDPHLLLIDIIQNLEGWLKDVNSWTSKTFMDSVDLTPNNFAHEIKRLDLSFIVTELRSSTGRRWKGTTFMSACVTAFVGHGDDFQSAARRVPTISVRNGLLGGIHRNALFVSSYKPQPGLRDHSAIMRLLLPLVAVCLLDLTVYAQQNFGNECEDILTPNDPSSIMKGITDIKQKKKERLQKEFNEALAKFPESMFKVSIVGDAVVVIPHPIPPQIIDVKKPQGEQVDIAHATPPPRPQPGNLPTTKSANNNDNQGTPPPKEVGTSDPPTEKAPTTPAKRK